MNRRRNQQRQHKRKSGLIGDGGQHRRKNNKQRKGGGLCFRFFRVCSPLCMPSFRSLSQGRGEIKKARHSLHARAHRGRPPSGHIIQRGSTPEGSRSSLSGALFSISFLSGRNHCVIWLCILYRDKNGILYFASGVGLIHARAYEIRLPFPLSPPDKIVYIAGRKNTA